MNAPPVKRVGFALGVLAVSIGLDQVTKRIATQSLMGQGVKSYLGDVFRLEYARNPGAFLSLGANLPEGVRFWLLTVGVGLVLAFLLYAALVQDKLTAMQRLAYLLMVSGGASNAWDRIWDGGKVTDFMNLGLGTLRTGIFNVADLAIVAGVVMMFIGPDTLRRRRKG